ncbi:MAG TPA: AAA family ATPase [Pirellulales bacterium]|nr:AAA family ATPase [Pirellulales bacterium]
MLLAGEPGIGKSRLTAALEDGVRNEAGAVLRYFCHPHHQGSPLQPVLAQLQHAAAFAAADTAEEKYARLETLIAPTLGSGGEEAALLAELLGLPASSALAAAYRDPQAKRRKILAVLLEQLEMQTRRGRVLMLFEDAHWADPSTLELLSLVVERLQTLPILLVITFRPDFQPPWLGQPHVTMLALNRLSQRDRATLVAQVTGGKALPPHLLEQIVERTDGVPLFVEELTKSVLESEQLQDSGDRYVVDRPTEPLAIPATLLSFAAFLKGWLMAVDGTPDAGIPQMLAAADEAPAAVLQPALLTLIAEQQMRCGHFDAAVATMDRAGHELSVQHNRLYEPEMTRIRGEIAVACSAGGGAEAEAAFKQAIDIAAGQSSRMLELRAAASLASLLKRGGRADEARLVLAPRYGAFTEGFDTPDLRKAKVLLDELA